MELKNFIIVLGVLSMLVLVGCAQQQTKYVCSDGTTVSDASYCPKQESRPAQTQQKTSSYCGDNICQSSESCSSCPSDCGACQQETQKECKTIQTSGGRFSQMYGIPAGMTYWIENVCGYEINDVFDEPNSRVGNRYCQGNVLVDEYFTCESNQCIPKARRFNCADLASGGICNDNGASRPECVYTDSSGKTQIRTTN